MRRRSAPPAALLLALAVGCAPAVPGPSGPAPVASRTPAVADVSATPTPRPTASSSAPAPGSPSPTAAGSSVPEWRAGRGLPGVDVSAYQPRVDWRALRRSGHAFVWIKATEGTSWRSRYFASQRTGARTAGLLQGAYHYARPAASSGADQARFFVAHGGGWAPDGASLPGALDLELATRGDACHGLSPSRMVAWIRGFSNAYLRSQRTRPVIYTSTEFWSRCTGSDETVGASHRLWLFDHGVRPGRLPAGWDRPTVWQRGVVAGIDRNVFFGSLDDLRSWSRMG